MYNGSEEKSKVDSTPAKREEHRLRIVEDARRGTVVQGLEEVLVKDSHEVGDSPSSRAALYAASA